MSGPLVLRFDVKDDGTVTLGRIKQEVRGLGNELDSAKAKASLLAKAWGGVTGVLSSVKNAVFSLKGALAGLGVGLIVRDFINTAAETERLRLTMNLLTGSVEEGRRQFDLLRKYAMESPSTFQEIMRAAVMLRGALKTDSGQTLELTRMADDIAARFRALGITTEIAGGQIVRMWSAGASAADQFREKGVTAMLGFKMGVQYSAEETRRMLLAAYNDPANHLKGFATGLKTTWDGIVSMIEDAWYDVKTKLADAGAFDAMKAQMDRFRAWLVAWVEANRDTIREWGEKAGEYVSKAGEIFAHLPETIGKVSVALRLLLAMQLAAWMISGWEAAGRLAAALLEAGKAWAAFGAAVKATAITAIIFGTVEAILYLRRHSEVAAQVWANLWFGMLKAAETVKVGVQNVAGDMTTAIKARFYEAIDEISNAWNWMQDKFNAVLPKQYEFSVSYQHTRTADLEEANERAKAERSGNLQYYLDELSRQQESMKQAAYEKAYPGEAPSAGPRSSGTPESPVDWAGQLSAKEAAAAKEKEAAARAASLELAKARDIYQAIEDRNRGIEEIDRRRLELTRQIEVAGEKLTPLSESEALDRDYSRQRELLAAKRQELDVQLKLAQAQGDGKDKLDKLLEIQQQIQSLDKEAANLPILEALDKEIQKRQEIAQLTQAQNEAAIKSLETQKAAMESGAAVRIDALQPADKNRDSVQALEERNRIALDALKQGYAYERRILDLRIQETTRMKEAAVQEAERVRISSELNALVAQRGILQNEEAQKVAQLTREYRDSLRSLKGDSFGNYIRQLEESVQNPAAHFVEAAQTIHGAFSNAFYNIMTEASTWKGAMITLAQEMRNAFIRAIADIMADRVMLEVTRGLTGIFPFFGSKSALGNIFAGGDLVPFALGGVLGEYGRVARFAYGGVVSRPTVFPMASGGVGLMGEAGPEAILPLARTSEGRLGVSAQASQTVVQQPPIELTIYNVVQGEDAVLATMAGDKGKHVIVNTITGDKDKAGPIRKMIRGDR